MDFELSRYTLDGYTVVELRGELDASTSPALQTGLEDLLNRRAPCVILDLSALTFLDSSALTVLVVSDRRAREAGGSLALAGPRQIVARVLSLTALDQHFAVYPTVADAIADRPAALD